ncbi:unnamed protein product [Rotaria sordida]|uniref:Receptor for retinol uptake STRA6 n=1 Tax=Rotaria sordida TaxID=392033 RepID=A0A813NCQ9_9BILA|nr:unnamed protein product [Rotaria sordida]CAF1031983.1 unnamed protein product [Rotaria sordida]
MSFKIFFLTCLLSINFFIQSATCVLSNNVQNLEFDDITSLWDKFPSIIDKIKETVNRFRCPKGWKRLGGSCYYLSNLTSISSAANHTCNYLHSNLSNLIQIRNAVELFYTAHVLTRNDLSSLMISIDPNFLKGKKIAETLMNDQGRWNRMKSKFHEVRVKYRNLKQKIVDRLSSTGLRILTRSKKMKQIPSKQSLIHDEKQFNKKQSNITNIIFSNETTINIDLVTSTNDNADDEEYEYDDLDSSDESDEFEQIEDIRGICDQIAWNALDNNSTVYILTTYIVSDKIVCSLSDVEPDIEYHHICEYGRERTKVDSSDDRQHLVSRDRSDNDIKITDAAHLQQNNGTFHLQERRPTIAEEIMEFLLPRTTNPLLNPIKRNLVRSIWVGLLSVLLLSILFLITTIMYLKSFVYYISDEKEGEFSINDTIHLVKQCESISDYRRGNLIFSPFALTLILIFSWSMKRDKQCLDMCDRRPGLLPPIEPFRTGNRFTTATVFGIIAYEVLKIFEELLFNAGQPAHQGVLVELLERIAVVILVGLRYYPVLASLQLRNIVARFFSCLYILCDIVYTIVREGSCMGFLPLSGQYTVLEEAKLRRELGTWFIIYGLIKNIPHFFFLSYIGAELCVRFVYDSIYVPVKKKKSIWSAPIAQLDESEFAKYYVTKLFRRNRPTSQIIIRQNPNTDSLIDYEHETNQQNVINQSRIKKFFDFFYYWDDDFRFTTIATCTYTVAIVFLYYLACTFVFLYIARTTGHISFIRSYIEHSANVELDDSFTLKREIILSAIITAIIYGFQLFIGMQNYKKHKLQLYKGIYVDVPSADNFKRSSIASNSVHYSGFLVGYMAWGFVICFHLILLILIGIKILSLQIRQIELALAIIVPILVIYLLKMLSMASAGKFIFIQKLDNKLNLKSRKTYAIFIYFSFFADCFLGMASCIIRLIKATFLNVVFMARLDWSFLGRPLEKFDLGFAAYVSYLHMEVTYTNPVMLAFCYSLFDDIIQRRPKHCYDDECCIAPGELDDDNETETVRQNQLQQNRTDLTQNSPPVTYRRRNNNDGSVEVNTISNVDKPISKRTSQIETNQQQQDLLTTESQRGSIISTKENRKNISKKTKQKQSNIDNEEKQSNASTSTGSTSRQQLQFSSAPPIPIRKDLPFEQDQSDDRIDGDRSLKRKPYPTVAKLISQKETRLSSILQSSKINIDNQTDEDEDENISKPKYKTKEKKQKKSIKLQIHEDEDEDSSLSKQIIVAAEKKKQRSETRKKKSPQTAIIEDDDDNDGALKQQQSNKKKISNKSKKDISKSNISKEDDNSRRTAKTSNTIKMIIPSKQPIRNNQIIKQDSSSDNTFDSTTRSSKPQQDTTSTSYEIIDRKVRKKPDSSQHTKAKKSTDKYHQDTVRTEEEDVAVRPTTVYSPPSYNLATTPLDSYFLRTISYRKAQENTPPLTLHRPYISPIQRMHQDTNDDDSPYSEIVNDTIRSSISNRSYSKIGSLKTSSSYSNKQQKLEEQKQTEDDTNVETEEEEEEEEEQEERPDESHLLRSQPTSFPTLPTANSTMNTSIKSEKDQEIERIKRKKRLRFRWHFLYTLIRNYHLFDLRKEIQSRLAHLHLQRSSLIDEQQFLTTTTAEEPETTMQTIESLVPGERRGLGSLTSDIPTPIERRPPSTHRLFSVPVSLLNDYPQSPAERYIANRARMLYDVSAEQMNSPHISSVSQTPTIISAYNQQQQRNLMTTTLSDQSLGFHVSPSVIVHPPSDTSTRSREKQVNDYPIRRALQRELLTSSLFQPVSTSNQSTADYPLAASSIVTSPTLCTQMSHDQHMQVWRQNQVEKLQKRRRHCYIYGTPSQQPLVDRVSTATILTPQILMTIPKQQQAPSTSSDGKTRRIPTISPFRFPVPSDQVYTAPSSTISDIQVETNNQKSKRNRRQKKIPIPQKRMERLDEDIQETSNANKSLKMTSASTRRKDVQSSSSDITEV